jgi:hypothetical protein
MVIVSPLVVRGRNASAEATVPPPLQLTVHEIGFEVTWPVGGTAVWQVSPAGSDCCCAWLGAAPVSITVENAKAAGANWRHRSVAFVFIVSSVF